MVRRRPLLRAVAIGAGAFFAGKRRHDALERAQAKREQQAAATGNLRGDREGLRLWRR